MSGKWTPGPWVARTYGNAIQWKIRGYKLPRGGQWRTVATIGSPRLYTNPELDTENKANAHLIASAPDLYAALEKVSVYTVEGDDNYIYASIGGVVSRFERGGAAEALLLQFDALQRAALSKARGEA